MIRHISAIAIAALAVGLAPVATAQAASAATVAPAAKAALPNPCKTFTIRSADVLFGLSSHAHLSEVLRVGKSSKTCLTSHVSKVLATAVTRANPGNPPSQFKCHSRPALGPSGKLCLGKVKKLHEVLLQFRKHGVYLLDATGFSAGAKGVRLYKFGLAQYRHFKG
jgi:hypothetical protein